MTVRPGDEARLPRIILVTPGFHPARGGVEAHTTALTNQLIHRGFAVTVLTARRGIRRTHTTRHPRGYEVITYPAWRIQSMSVSPRLVLGAVLRGRTGDVVHVHGYHATTALSLLGVAGPAVFTPHYHGTHGHSRLADVLHRSYRRIAPLLLRRCDAIICVSSAERDQLLSDFPRAGNKVVVIPNGVSAAEIRSATAFPNQPQTVLCVGRLEAYKRFDDVIRAFAQVPAPTRLVIVGDGSERDELAAAAQTLGLGGRVELTGPASDETLHRWLRTARVLVSVSEREAFGIVPMEAACAGAKVVLSDIPAHRDIAAEFLGDTALFVSDRSANRLGAAIRYQLRESATCPAQVPDWSDVAATTAEVYLQSLQTTHEKSQPSMYGESHERSYP